MAIRTFRCLLHILPKDLAALAYEYIAPRSLMPKDIGRAGNYELCDMLWSWHMLADALVGATKARDIDTIRMLIERGGRPTLELLRDVLRRRWDPMTQADIVDAFIGTHLSQEIDETADWNAIMGLGFATDNAHSLATRAITAGAYLAFADALIVQARADGRHGLADKAAAEVTFVRKEEEAARRMWPNPAGTSPEI